MRRVDKGLMESERKLNNQYNIINKYYKKYKIK